ncbi:Mitochondrial ribosomal protein L27 [Forsythia ovata]|uniref:Mitochondrial ribosomal protein L27 n=1 Tax=Forsythia ovata TaxID=205694 RepID=A0ABD1SHP8_9LAMI
MPLGLIMGIGRAFRRKRTSSLDILTSKRSPKGYYKGKNCNPTGFHTRKGGYVVIPEKLPNYVVPDLTDFKEKRAKKVHSDLPNPISTNDLLAVSRTPCLLIKDCSIRVACSAVINAFNHAEYELLPP